MKVMVAVDLGVGTNTLIAEAVALARAFAATLEIAHVYSAAFVSVPPALDLLPLGPSASKVRDGEAAVVDRVKNVKAQGVACESFTSFGDPAAVLTQRAFDIGAGYLVVGTRKEKRLTHAILGSVAQRILHLASCPVLVVPLK